MSSPDSRQGAGPLKVGRPTASILLLAYNHAPFIEAALLSALRQDAAGYELVIVDDASTDATRPIIERVLAREMPPGIGIRKLFKERNEGLVAAVNSAMAMASGRLFVMMAGDDISLPDRLTRTCRHFEDAARVQLVYGEYTKVDEAGRILSRPASGGRTRRFSYDQAAWGKIYASASPFGASAAYRRELFDYFGPMRDGTHGEDNCYWVRALLLGVIIHDPACYVHWRQHGSNLSNFSANVNCPEWRRRHLNWMELHATMSPQWFADIRLAADQGVIGWARAWRLRWAAAREDCTWALEASSLRVDPWSRWTRRALDLLLLGRISSTLRFFKLRCSQGRRERRWKLWAKLKSNPGE
jgi:glycosyltransferase involved in cell wall biosynthesis